MIFNLEAGEVKTLPVLNTKYPENVTVKAGTNAVFTAVIEKDGIPTAYTYQWYVNNSLVSGATTAVYTRDTKSDSGVYSVYCEITNKAGSVKTRTATLTVNALPKLDSSYPADVSVTAGGSNTFKVSISTHGYPKSYTYQWYLNGSKISGATGTSVTINGTTIGEHKVYCAVTNAAGTVNSRTATYTVKAGYLYNSGTINTGLTGGLKGYAHKLPSSTSTEKAPTVTLGSTSITLFLKGANGEGYSGVYYVVNPIDLTNVKKIRLTVTAIKYNTEYSNISIITTKSRVNNFSRSATKKIEKTGTFDLDVSSLTGLHYIGILLTGAYDKTITFNKWQLI